MNIIHRVCATIDANVCRQLRDLGFDPFQTPFPLVVEIAEGSTIFEVTESHPNWTAISCVLRDLRPIIDIVRTEFSKKETAAARYLLMKAKRQYGYPQPRPSDFGYLEATYDLRAYCDKCGAGKIQNVSFQMKGEVDWGKRDFLQLNWVLGEFFVSPEIWHEFFKPFEIGWVPVLHYRTKEPLRSVVQLDCKRVAESALDIEREIAEDGLSKLDIGDYLVFEKCEVCGSKKYHSVSRGLFPSFKTDVKGHAWRTQEVFGSGGQAWNELIVSGAVAKAIQSRKLSGVRFVPMKGVE